jgi:hypothetical protein
MSERGDNIRIKRVELGRINMTTVNVPDLFAKLSDYMLMYGVDLDFGVEGPWFIITGEHKHLNEDERLRVGVDLLRNLTSKAMR